MANVNFIYPHNLNTIGGAEHMTLLAAEKLKKLGHTVTNSEFHYSSDLPDGPVIFVGRQIKEIEAALNDKRQVYLIGYYSFYHTFTHCVVHTNAIQHIGEFVSLFNYDNFHFICMTENDIRLACLINPEAAEHCIIGTNLMPEVKELAEPGNYEVLNVARMCEQKNNLEFEKLAIARPELYFNLTDVQDVDEPWYQESVHKHLKPYKNIKFIPPEHNVDGSASYWNGVKCLVLTSAYETMPLVMGEALSKGIPVVMYDVVTPDVQHFHNVTVVPQGYYHDLLNAIDKVETDRLKVAEQYKVDRDTYEHRFNTIVDAIVNIVK